MSRRRREDGSAGRSLPRTALGLDPRGRGARETRPGTAALLIGAQRRTGKVLVLGSDNRAALAVVRSLGRRGLEVHVAWCPADAPPARSRYCRAVHELPPFSPTNRRWLDAIKALAPRERFDLVVPCNDLAIIPLQQHRGELASCGGFFLLSEHAFATTFDKVKTAELADSLGVRAPAWRVLTHDDQVEKAADELQPPVVLKPISSFDLREPGAEKRKVAKVYSRASFVSEARKLLAAGDVLVQSNFNGIGVGVELLVHEGEVLFAFQHERVHEGLHGSGSSYRRSVPLDPELLAASRKLVGALAYTGAVMVEFKVDPRTRDWILIEMNGRFWGSLPLAVAAGADFPAWLYDMLVEGRRDFPAGYRTGVYARNLKLDLSWFVRNLRADKRDPTLQTRRVGSVLAEIRHLALLREHNDTLVADDLRPGLDEIAGIFRKGSRKALAKVPAPAVGAMLRRTRAGRVLASLPPGATVEFVCRGNIFRSAFAAAYARRLFPAMTLRSSGSYPVADRSSPEAAIAAADLLGVDLRAHRSTVTSRERLASADLVVVFDARNRREVLSLCPEAAGKTFELGALARRGPLLVPDPYGKTPEVIEDSFRRIAAVLDEVERRRSSAAGSLRPAADRSAEPANVESP